MASVPVTIVAMVYPRNKTVEPYPATIQGFANITGLGVGGGPILPPDEVPPVDPPLVIWGGGNEPFPTPPIFIPPDLPPDNPPPKPVPPHEGWNWSAAKSGWYFLYVPRPGTAEPKK